MSYEIYLPATGLIPLTMAAVTLIRSKKTVAAGDGKSPEEAELETIRARHAAIREEVAAAEKDENMSLQIYSMAKSLSEAISWKEMAPRLTTGLQRIFGAHEFLLYAFEADGKWKLLHRRGAWSQEPPVRNHLPEEVEFLAPTLTTEVVPVLAVPVHTLSAAGSIMNGVMFLKPSLKDISETELFAAGRQCGQQLGMAINKALLFSQMEMHSRVDGLTGVLRRQPFMDRLQEELKKSRAFHTPLSVAMVDIDHFKAVNDSHGHAAGDAVLKRVGELLKESIYETDVVCRYGGEEFILLFPKAESGGVLRKVESLRQRIQSEVIASGFEQLKITVSIGLAHYPLHGNTAEGLIARADEALYQAKGTGRNRVIVASMTP